MINAKNLSFITKDKKSLITNMNLDIQEGSITGIVGRNGAGKSTLISLLAGIQEGSSGQVFYDDKNIQNFSSIDLAKKRSLLSQQNSTNFRLSIVDILLMGRYPFGKIHETDYDYADYLIEELKLKQFLETPFMFLSGGEKQKVHFARSIMQLYPLEKNSKKVLFLDEPLSALDLSVQQQLLRFIKNLVKKFNLTIVLVLHDLNWVSKYCHNIFVLDEGELCLFGSPENVFTRENLKKFFHVEAEITRTKDQQITITY
tara:strand:+ start:5944 stop:6717 length:774 start_codon:yes stop_codon:yes gene_type:complete